LIWLELPKVKDKRGSWKKEGLNGEHYAAQIVNGPLSGFVNQLEMMRLCPMLVVEDGAPAHRSKVVKLAQTVAGISNLWHPANSPDLNPIENIWDLLKTRI